MVGRERLEVQKSSTSALANRRPAPTIRAARVVAALARSTRSKRSVWEVLGGAPSKISVRAALFFKGVFARRSLGKGVFGRQRSLEKKCSGGAPSKIECSGGALSKRSVRAALPGKERRSLEKEC